MSLMRWVKSQKKNWKHFWCCWAESESGEKETRIDVNIIVEYGTRIPDVAFEIQNKVKVAVEKMTGLKVVEVNVHVQGVSTQNMENNNTNNN